MPNIVLSILGRDQSSGATRTAGASLEQLTARREAAARALTTANQRESDSAGRLRVAEAQLAEARQRYGAESSQVIRAEERLASAQRSAANAHGNSETAAGRLAGALRRLTEAEEQAARAGEQSSQRLRSSWSGVGRSVTEMAGRATSGIGSITGKLGELTGGIAKQGLGVAAGFAVYNVGANLLSGAYDTAKSAVFDFNTQLENADIGFTTMLGSGKKSREFLDQLQSFAKTTPFEFTSLVSNSQRMLGMGISAKDIIPSLRALGDSVASIGGSAQQVDSVTLAFSQMAAKGTLDMGNVQQLAENGVPTALKVLASSYGVTTGQMIKMISSGKVLSSDALPRLVKGIEQGTKSTAALGGMMDKQSRTATGALSNISDAMNQALGKAGKPFFKMFERGAIDLANFTGSKDFQNWTRDVTRGAQDVVKFVRPILSTLRDLGQGKGLPKGAPAFLKPIADALRGLPKDSDKTFEKIGRALKKAEPDLEDFATSTGPALVRLLRATVKTVGDAADVLGELAPVLRPVGKALGFVLDASPVKMFQDFKTVLGGIQNPAKLVGRISSGELGPGMKIAADAGTAITRAIRGAIQALVQLGARVIVTARNLPGALVQAGRDMLAGLVRGISGGIGDALATVRGLAAQVTGAFKAALKIQSPSKVFEELGKFITQGLVQGISTGSRDDVDQAMSDLAEKVKGSFDNVSDEVKKARATIKTGDRRMDRLDDAAASLARRKRAAEARLAAAKTAAQKRAAQDALENIEASRQQNVKDRQEAREDIADAKAITRKFKSAEARKIAEKRANAAVAAGTKQLEALASRRDAAAADLEAAQARLDAAIEMRDSYAADVTSSVLGLGNVSTTFGTARDAQQQALTDLVALQDQLADVQKQLTETDVPDTVADLTKQRGSLLDQIAKATTTAGTSGISAVLANVRKQADDADEFKGLLAQLKGQGLDDTSYKQLVDDYAGGSGLSAARDLLSSGGDTIRQLAGLQGRLKASSDALGLSTSGSLYQAGVDSATGFVNGLKSQVDELTKTMTGIADAMVKTIKNQLGIKSPSTVFRAQGVFVTQGLVQGLLAGKGDVAGAIDGLVPTTVGVPNVAGAGTSGGRGRPGVYIGQLNMTNGATAPELVAALDWMGRTST